MKMEEIAKCSKCGAEPVCVVTADEDSGEPMYSIECSCGAKTARKFTEQKAVTTWNRVQNRNPVYDDVLAELRY